MNHLQTNVPLPSVVSTTASFPHGTADTSGSILFVILPQVSVASGSLQLLVVPFCDRVGLGTEGSIERLWQLARMLAHFLMHSSAKMLLPLNLRHPRKRNTHISRVRRGNPRGRSRASHIFLSDMRMPVLVLTENRICL